MNRAALDKRPGRATMVRKTMEEELGNAERERYGRHLLIPEIGIRGQLKLRDSAVLMIGSGALGSPAAMYLAAAGVGKLTIIDPDFVERSNLHRQILHSDAWIGKPKTASAAARLREVNPHVEVHLLAARFTPENAMEISAGHDVIVDGSDNFPTRFLANDAAFFQCIPLVHGAIHRFEGQATVFAPHLGGPCYRCMLPAMPAPGSVPSCAEAGVLGVLPGIIGSLQAMETVKLLLGIGEPPVGKLIIYDGLRTSFRSLRLRRDPDCALCGNNPRIRSVENPETTVNASCTTDMNDEISPAALRSLLAAGFSGTLIDVREPHEHAAGNIPQAILIPLGSLSQRLAEIPADRPVILHCKAGGRSARALGFLKDNGFSDVRHLAGGFDAWEAQ